jgi:hypothetical protein
MQKLRYKEADVLRTEVTVILLRKILRIWHLVGGLRGVSWWFAEDMNCFRLTTLTVMQCAAASQSPVNHCALVLLRDLGRQRVNASTATHLSPSVDSSFVLRHGPISNSSASPSYRTPRRDISVLYLGPYFAHRVSTSMCLRLARSSHQYSYTFLFGAF